MVNIIKIFFNVEFQSKTRCRKIGTNLADILDYPTESFMSAFFITARITIKNKALIKYRLKMTTDGVMKQSVPNACFMDNSRFGVINVKLLITCVFVAEVAKIVMKQKNVFKKIAGKITHISSFIFTNNKLFPGGE